MQTDTDFINDMRVLGIDHAPDGYPAVQMQQIDRLIGIIDRQSEMKSPVDTATWARVIEITYSSEHKRYFAATNWGRREGGDTPLAALGALLVRNAFYYGVEVRHMYPLDHETR